MNLIDVYIHEVTKRLPVKSREDIALELRSTIEDMLPDEYSDEDIKSVLKELGNPAVLASEYSEKPMYLIGPRYFDVYVTLLKMIVPIVAVVSIISLIAEYVIGYKDEAILYVFIEIFGIGIWRLIEASIQVFFWCTLTFAIIERVDRQNDQTPRTINMTEWNPDDLKNIPYIPKENAIKKFEVFGSLLWTAVWVTVYFYADRLIGIYENNGDGLTFVMPALNQEVLNSFTILILIIVVLEVVLALYKLIAKHWTIKLAIFNIVYELVATVVLIVIVTNSNLLNPQFITYMADLFTLTEGQFKNSLVIGTIAIFVVFAIWNSIDGFRKANNR